MTIAPQNPYAERTGRSYEVKRAASIPGQRGPLRFEEGVATDTDVPQQFARGAYYDTTFAPGRLNHNNAEMQYKHADETMRERAHLGSAAWNESPAVLRDFVQGAGVGQSPPSFEMVMNPLNRRQNRPAITIVRD